MTIYKQPVSVLVVIHTPTLQVLLLERAAHPGFWQSVTGSRENTESMLETARREVMEETGLNTAHFKLTDWQTTNEFEIFPQWRHRYAPGITHNIEHVFSLEVPENQLITTEPKEHRAHQWKHYTEAADLCFSSSNRDAILALPTRL